MAALRKVLVVIGTTGAGKTKLSVDLAKAVGGEIVNSDAMQVRKRRSTSPTIAIDL